MKAESIVLGIAGAFFGLIVGWVIGSQQTGSTRQAGAAPVAAAQPAQAAQGQSSMPPAQPKALDDAQAQALRAAADRNPSDAKTRAELGNLYFDAERYSDAAGWYEAALKIDPSDPNVRTDLGVAYYYLNQPDRALQEFDRSLQKDPAHAKTLLNQGIVRAFGKQDLRGAVVAWEKLIEVAPKSPEADTARRALQTLKTAHPDVGKSNGTAPGQ